MLNNNKNKNRIIVISSAIILGIVILLLFVIDFNTAIKNSINKYEENQNLLAVTIMQNAVDLSQKDDSKIEDTIIRYIQDEFPTSSSVYCILAINDEIVFLKDENTTSTLMDEKISNYFTQNNISARDNKKYIVSKAEAEYNNDNYTLVLCTKQNYFVKKIKLYEVRLHSLGYFVIYGLVLTIIIIFSFYKLHSEETDIAALGEEVKKSRRIIDKLENDKNKHYVNSEREGDYSFYNRCIIDEVISCLSEDDKMKCIQVDIFVESLKMEHFVSITAILGRIKAGNSIACYWENNQFKVLLFQSGKQEAQAFMNLFISKYKSESEERVEDLKIVATKLLGGEHEI